jgi:SMC interacting uncharacterized protein involved in chromosome segregation
MKKLIFPLVIVVLLFWIFVDKCNYSNLSNDFKVKQDSLVQAVDSLQIEIAKDDSVILVLNELDNNLQEQVDIQKNKIKTVVKYVEIEKNKIDTYSEAELISSLNQRYPADTVTNPLPVAQPVLNSAAKDLAEFDGAKQELIIKDSIIFLDETKLTNKDSIIAVQNRKELNYNNIVVNQGTQIKDWKFQYNTLQLENHKLKIKNKFTKLAAGIVIGGLTYLMISK